MEDAVLNLGSLRTINRRLCDKKIVLKALAENDLPLLREVSNFFYRTSGIYQSACNYVATMYRYDWYIVPEVYKDSVKEEEVVKRFRQAGIDFAFPSQSIYIESDNTKIEN